MLIENGAFLAHHLESPMHPLLHAFLAQTADGQPAPSPLQQLGGFMPLVLIAVVFYFVFFRPQQKQAKEHQSFVTGLQKGQEVVTQGGLIGTVVLVEDRTVTLDVGAGTKVRVLKGNVLGPYQEKPVAAAAKQEKK
jgi:preprotein translocase subunit YajC